MAALDEDDGRMADEAQSFFLVPASSGQCIEQRLGELYASDLNGQEQQRWRLEYDPEDSNNVAFKNVLSDAYLCFSNGIMGARVMTRSGTSQYFRLETSNTPGALRIQSVNYPKTYLCNSHGYWSVNNQAITWVREPHLTRTTLWYIVDHDAWKAQKEQLYRPDSAISIHGSSRHDPATARGRSDVQPELQRTEVHDDTLPGPNPPSTAPQKIIAEKEQPLGAKDTIPMEGKEQLTARETAMYELLEAKELGVADRERLNDAREAKAAADMAGKTLQESFPEGEGEQPLGTKGEAVGEVLSDQAQAVRGEGPQGGLPSNAANPEKVQEQAERDPTTLHDGEMSGFEPPQEGRLGAKPLENAALNMPKPERIVTEPKSLRTNVPEEDRSDQKAGIPPPAQMDSQEDGVGARKLEDAQICAPDVNPPSSLDPRRDGIGAPSPSLPGSLQSASSRAFGFFDLGDRDRERPALRPIVMPTEFSHLKRL